MNTQLFGKEGQQGLIPPNFCSLNDALLSLVQYMSGTVLDYTVEDKKSYVVTKGSINKMQEKSSGGFLIDKLLEDLELTIKLNSPSLVHIVQIAPVNIGSIGLRLIDKDETVIESNSSIFSDNSPNIIQFRASKANKSITCKIVLNAVMRGQNEGNMGIRYLVVKGDKLGLPTSFRDKANVSKRPTTLTDPRESPHAPKIKINTAFGERKKYKDSKDLTKKEEKHQFTEDEQMRMAIQASKRDAEQKGIQVQDSSSWLPKKQQSRQTNRIRQQEKDYEQWQRAQKPREYPLVDFEKVKHFFANVNQNWLQAQRRAEIEAGIPEKHRLSSCIQVKHFHGKTLCLDLPVTKRKTIQKLALSMGARIVQDVCDNCLLIAARPDSEKVAKARKMKNVRIVTPNFVEESKQVQAYLDEKSYFLKL